MSLVPLYVTLETLFSRILIYILFVALLLRSIVTFCSKSTRQKPESEEHVISSNRTLMEFSDNILVRIISLLPIKDAVRTSILAKRWKYLWTSIPDLRFVQGLPSDRTDFKAFITRTLAMRDSLPINGFSLEYDVLSDSPLVGLWIAAVVRHNVQTIKLNLSRIQGHFALPYSLVTSTTLTTLHIDILGNLRVPSPSCFSSLKELSIIHVTFYDESSTQRLLSGCPVLEKLLLCECNWVNVKVMNISSPRLRSLTIYENHCCEEYLDGCEIIISGSSLKNFNFMGEFFTDYCFLNASSLEVVEIDILSCYSDNSRHGAFRLCKLLKSISEVPKLTIAGSFIELLHGMPELLDHMPSFSCLRELELGYGCSNIRHKGLLKILQSTPCLETLSFIKGLSFSSTDDTMDDMILNPVPQCLLYHLKRIYILQFTGCDLEIDVVEILLKNSLVLSKMVLDFEMNLKRDEACEQQLMIIPRGSQDCELNIMWGKFPSISMYRKYYGHF